MRKTIALALGLGALAAGPVCAAQLTASDITDPSSQFFDPANGHIYEVVNSAVTWTEALNDTSNYSIAADQGYLVTITSASENAFVFNLAHTYVSKGWDGQSIWLGASDAASEGNWKWVSGPEAGLQFWSGENNGSGISGTYNNMYAPYIQNENSACGISGCWSNSTGTGSNDLFMYGGAYTPGYWDDAYSSTTALSGASSPIVSSDGVRNAYIVEFSSAAPDPATWALMILGLGGIGATMRLARPEKEIKTA